MRSAVIRALMMTVFLPGMLAAQRIGVLPFEDAPGVGPQFWEQVVKLIRSEC